MQSDHGHDTPSTGGDDRDEAVWLDLVARLQEPDDSFMEGALPEAADEAGTPPAAPAAGPSKGVDDFDPLGVWRRQLSPAPEEPPYGGGRGGSASPDTGPRDYAAADPDDEFVPPVPPSLAGAEPAMVLAWIGAAGGPIFLVLAAIFWRGMPLVAVIGVILAFLAGTGYLIYRLPKNRDHEGGDGAVV
ncbi:hypothetical protein [Arthrobacter sp. STN4]|uniref:hypothetical protein n=1 Tax=Arthrobacter sp. STN4 TaxID=2923276 RepID=UPI002119D4AE|nr:hypothetical protein [Arthrobacter sp. STN4]MCQ9164282.1 hypothetical protein [Arthrobacter sp. STN4]